jgi:hypothetical protein
MNPTHHRSHRSFCATIAPTNELPLLSRGGAGTVLAGLWLAVLLSAAGSVGHAQGCVAGGFCPLSPILPTLPGDVTDSVIGANHWQASLAYRWFRSDRHFVGDVEQPQRQALGTEVINDVHSFDLSLTYGITPRWSATLTVPFIDADRSSLYEHDRTNRHSMHSGGLGDIRVVTDFWLLDPHTHMSGNVALGVGLKAPTGHDSASDTAYRATGPVERPVDPSTQPGDGGWGFILQLQTYQKIYGNLFGYLQGSYMITPEEQSDTQRTTADLSAPGPTTFNTIADQYFGRGGFSQVIWPSHGVTLSCGARIEGVPVYDAIGGSMGFRRPGCTISIEPGISWAGKKNSLTINAPVAVYRNRERSAPEVVLGRPGGDAAFADFSILASFTHRF